MNQYNRMRFKKNNKHRRGVKVHILEKAITKPNETCICPLRTKIISNGKGVVIPMQVRDYVWFCPAHSKKKGGS